MNNLYADIAARTGGNIYIGVVGPVRTGKSTLIKRIMETAVIPHIQEPYRAQRAIDELPQSGSGKTIMTSEPKFVPEEAVEICPDKGTLLRVRMIDSVGYMIKGAVGADEEIYAACRGIADVLFRARVFAQIVRADLQLTFVHAIVHKRPPWCGLLLFLTLYSLAASLSMCYNKFVKQQTEEKNKPLSRIEARKSLFFEKNT